MQGSSQAKQGTVHGQPSLETCAVVEPLNKQAQAVNAFNFVVEHGKYYAPQTRA